MSRWNADDLLTRPGVRKVSGAVGVAKKKPAPRTRAKRFTAEQVGLKPERPLLPLAEGPTCYEFMGVQPTMNKVMRGHWRKRGEHIDRLIAVVKSQNPHRYKGRVRVSVVRYHWGQPADYDGAVGAGKYLIDSLVRAGVIEDDSPRIIEQPPSYTQVKCGRREEQRTLIYLESVEQ